MTIKINRTIFRSYDIRGSSLSDLTPLLAYKIGFTFTKINMQLLQDKICVGRDGRLSSPILYKALVKGIIDAGGEVVSLGIVPSPILYFADIILRPCGSIMITGSHNPKDDNGFKLLAASKPFYNNQIQNLYEMILTSKCPTSKCNLPNQFPEESKLTTIDINNIYIDRILQDLTLDSNLKVVWDSANGAAGYITELLKRKLPNKNLLINFQIDGNFPAHHPDPTISTNLTQLINLVQQENCDIGIAFDGDADRLAVISKTGRMISGEQILCILAKDVLAQKPNATIIMDIKTSLTIFNQIKAYGGNPQMWKTGHSHIKDKIQETKALLAGETSGHIFFADKYYGYDDGIYAAIRLLDLLSRTRKSLDEMIEELPKIPEPVEIKIPIKDAIKFTIIEQIKRNLIDKNIIFNGIDGVRVNSDIGWWLIRASNTEAKIIVRYQPNSPELHDKLQAEFKDLLYSFAFKNWILF